MRIGILGAGQLGRMLALAGYPLGMVFRLYDPDRGACAAQVADVVHGAWDDDAALAEFAKGCDVVTFEFENVPLRTIKVVAEHAPVFPPLAALESGQHRALEKQLFELCGLHVPSYAVADDADDVRAACARVGLPAIAKTTRGGYDGKGQFVLRTAADIDRCWPTLASGGSSELLIEQLVPFSCEVSLVGVRGRDGCFVHYPLTHNRHERGILRESCVPVALPPGDADRLTRSAATQMRTLMDRLQYVGVLAIEFFVVDVDGVPHLLANEMAPRVHNSGHWTIDAGIASQFENHLRAVVGLPLGSCLPRPGARSAMVNFIGAMPPPAALLALPNVHVHDYGKTSRQGRKVGHATLTSDASDPDHAATLQRLIELARACDA